MIWAFASGCSLCFHKSNRGFWSMMVLSSGMVMAGEIEPTGGVDFFYIHGWFMWSAWGILGYITLLSNRYLKRYYSFHMWIHGIAASIALGFTFALGFLALKEGNWKVDVVPHSVMGLIVMGLSFFLYFGGLSARYAMETRVWNSKLLLRFRFMHRLLGWFMLVLGNVTILFGILKYTRFFGLDNLIGIIYTIAFFLVCLMSEIIFQVISRGRDAFVDPDQKITNEEFREKVEAGEKLVILDDLVLDVRPFMKNHPGGKFVIEHNVGKDISKFFYGGYVMEPSQNLKPYTHSNIARKIANSLTKFRLSY